MTAFVLVHGAWHGGWCWQRLAPLLEARGHRVAAPDLPGMGADATPAAQITLGGWADFVAETARAMGEPVVLVGHSRGGVVVSQAAERAPETVAGLIYLAAILLPAGSCVMDMAGDMSPEGLAAMRPSADGLSTTLDRAAAAGLMYNTTEAPWTRMALDALGPDPGAPNLTPLQLSSQRYGAKPRAYIECLRDRTLSIDLQRRMQAKVPCLSVLTLDTDHAPFFSAPGDLCEALIAAAQF